MRWHPPVHPMLALLLVASFNSSTSANHLMYVVPLDGASFVSPETNIVLRADGMIGQKTVDRLSLVVIGSRSGTHSGRLILSDDFKTLVFSPARSFLLAETVTVVCKQKIPLADGTFVDPNAFSFTITPTNETAQSKDIFASEMFTNDHESPPAYKPGVSSPLLQTSLPPDFPLITISASDSPTDGGIFLANIVFNQTIPNLTYLMILDNAGTPISYDRIGPATFDFVVQSDGLLTYFRSDDNTFFVTDSAYRTVGSFTGGNGYTADLHELRLLPNGHAILIALDYQRVRMDTIVPGGNPNALVTGNTIHEFDQYGNVVFEWRSWDHFRITDATHENLTAATIDYVHMNAIDIDTDGNLLLSSRHLDEITKINRQTGSIMWRLGGKNNQFVFTNDTLKFSHQHAVRRISNGHITLFDNGNYHTPQFSRAVEYQLDEVGKTATLAWQYRNSPDIYGGAMGYVQRLDNGNTLIGWGATNPSVTEVRSDGSKAIELNLPPGVFSYRAFRFPWSSQVETLSTSYQIADGYRLEQNYPNPFNPTTTIRFALAQPGRATIKIYDVLGREMATVLDETLGVGVYERQWNASEVASGIYFYRLTTAGFSLQKKIAVVR